MLIPFPDSGCARDVVRPPRTVSLAEAVAAQGNANVLIADILRWNKPQQPSHKGGSRDFATLATNLGITQAPPEGTLVLVDDVMTTGAHILAGVMALHRAGVECKKAICVARTSSSCQPTFTIRKVAIYGTYPSQRLSELEITYRDGLSRR